MPRKREPDPPEVVGHVGQPRKKPEPHRALSRPKNAPGIRGDQLKPADTLPVEVLAHLVEWREHGERSSTIPDLLERMAQDEVFGKDPDFDRLEHPVIGGLIEITDTGQSAVIKVERCLSTVTVEGETRATVDTLRITIKPRESKSRAAVYEVPTDELLAKLLRYYFQHRTPIDPPKVVP